MHAQVIKCRQSTQIYVTDTYVMHTHMRSLTQACTHACTQTHTPGKQMMVDQLIKDQFVVYESKLTLSSPHYQHSSTTSLYPVHKPTGDKNEDKL